MVHGQVNDRVVSKTTKDGSYPVVSPMGSVVESITSESEHSETEPPVAVLAVYLILAR